MLRRRGYTIIELLLATVLTLVVMAGVVTLFGRISSAVTDSRSSLEMTGNLRLVRQRLQDDLRGATATMTPPRDPSKNEGYFVYIEGPVGPVIGTNFAAANSDTGEADTTVGDFDDILILTTRSQTDPFIGKFGAGSFESHEAEVAWFLRGNTLYRRVLLVAPQAIDHVDTDTDGVIGPELGGLSFFGAYDLSARPAYTASGQLGWIPNTLGDLTKPENRYAHRLHPSPAIDTFPYDPRRWGELGLPTLRETSDPNWMQWKDLAGVPQVAPWLTPGSPRPFDLWTTAPHPWVDNAGNPVDPVTGTLAGYMNGNRGADDVVLANVIGFDVKAWDPGAPVLQDVATGVALLPGDPGYGPALASLGGASPTAVWISSGAYVDLNYAGGGFGSAFDGPGTAKSQLAGAGLGGRNARVYDSGSTHYERDKRWVDLNGNGVADGGEITGNQDGDGLYDEGTNGIDDDNDGVVDDPDELETMPPYPARLRGIQVRIRVFEPDSRQVREVTVVQEFLAK